MELGETGDPRDLVPGDPTTIRATAQALRARGDSLHQAGAGLQRIDTADGWSGPAGDAFRAKFQGQPGKWLEAGDCFHQSADALDSYVQTLTWAQTQAADAITQWNSSQNASNQATAQHQRAEQQAAQALPFDDPGEAGRQAARRQLARARSQLDSVGDSAAGSVGTAGDKAPKKPSFWSKVGNFFSDVGAGLENAGGHVVNGLASFGNAVADHPGDVGTAAAGAGLMLLGGVGEVGGGALDLTGVGIIPGVAVNAASTAAIVAGGGLVAGGAADLMMHATSDDSVSPARTDHTGSGGDEGFEPDEGFRNSEFSKDEIVEFINGHTGDGDPTMRRPTRAQIDEALTQAEPEPIPGQNAEEFNYKDYRVIVNYDMPWRSTSYFPER
jgi:hypothetical protein